MPSIGLLESLVLHTLYPSLFGCCIPLKCTYLRYRLFPISMQYIGAVIFVSCIVAMLPISPEA